MANPTISAIAAIGSNRELGHGNELIWRIPADLKRLKALTTGHPIIMGRKTYESIGRPLPDRTNIVISRNPDYPAPGCTVVTSLADALATARAREDEEVFIFGGAAIYALAWPHLEKLYLTVIEDTAPAADAYFPPYHDSFTEVARISNETETGLRYHWVDLVRT